MTSIEHLSPEERTHFILCVCGNYLDMRNLAEVFEHMHANLPKPVWTHSKKKDEPAAYLQSGTIVNLN